MANVDTMCENVYDAGGKELDMSGKGRFAQKRIKLFEVCYYADPIPSLAQTGSLTPYTLHM